MSRYVVDASVAVKWLIPEPGSVAALTLLDGNHELLAPDLLFPEFGNVLWKKARRGELQPAEAIAALDALTRVPLTVLPSAPHIVRACELALASGRTAYDSLYVAVAEACGAVLVTADERLVHALAESPLANFVRFVGHAAVAAAGAPGGAGQPPTGHPTRDR